MIGICNIVHSTETMDEKHQPNILCTNKLKWPIERQVTLDDRSVHVYGDVLPIAKILPMVKLRKRVKTSASNQSDSESNSNVDDVD